MVVFAATGGPAKKNAGPPLAVTGEVIRNVFTSAFVEVIEQIEDPLAELTVHAP